LRRAGAHGDPRLSSLARAWLRVGVPLVGYPEPEGGGMEVCPSTACMSAAVVAEHRHAVAIQASLKVVASTAETERPTVGDGDVAGDARKNL
jgi:hypothetical protein